MDFGEATSKIADITLKIMEFYEKIMEIRNKFIAKINGYLEDIERTVNNAISQSKKWIEMQINKITKKINDALAGLKKKIDDIIAQLRDWYENVILNIKVTVVKAVFAILNQRIDRNGVIEIAKVIPHKPLDSMLPDFSLQIAIPDPSQLINVGPISLPRL